ncbi:hypothetical protein AGOR_G00049410 [Albula goreensis]|uniref:Glutathione hydrolase 6 n=1 Tax=Albula goreensis TaxID=1534307 RepID=A0A8T3E1F2_9TELE|nr:hypothetical protein AGOR_G00049410 [Albula goreensis]
MSINSVRYEKLRSTESDNYDEQESDRETPEDEEEVTVFIYQSSTHQHKVRQRWRDTIVRLTVALVLLALALSFVICEWRGCLSQENTPGDLSVTAGHSGTGKNEEGHGHHHHDEDDSEEDQHHHGNSGHHEHRHPNLYHHGVVITDSGMCSGIGREILEDGGNFVDAGLASLLCLGVVHPHAAGLGGVFSAILYNATSKTYKAIQSTCSGSSSASYGIPATLQGIKQLHSLFGNYKWEKLFSGAVKLAKDGFLMDEVLARALIRNQARVVQSNLCDLFCDGKDNVKVLGSRVANQNLAELLHHVSLNSSHIPENLAVKLAQDLAPSERQGFVEKVQQCRAEINDPLIMEKEEYTLLAAISLPSSWIISNVLERASKQNLPLWSNVDLNHSDSTYISLLTSAKLIYNHSVALENISLADLFALNPVGSHIGVLDNLGNVLIISTSLNTPFGAKQLLPSTGVILSDFDLHPADKLLLWSCPLIVKVKEDDDDNDDEEVLAIGVTGGLSAPFIAAQMIGKRVHAGKSAPDAMASPIVHLESGSPGSLLGCVSEVSHGSDMYQMLLEGEEHFRGTDRCSDDTMVSILQLHAGHVGAYGAPVAKAHTSGY